MESKFTTLWGNPCFLPGLESPKFRNWKDKEISAIKDIFDPGGDFFMYLQARHFAQSCPTVLRSFNPKDAFFCDNGLHKF